MMLTATAADLERGVIDVDGIYDERADGSIQYIGKAQRMPDGTWRTLANVGGCLCVCEVTITHPSEYEA